MTFCKNCGTKLNPQDEFCPNCGTKNETPQQPQQPDGMGADAVTAVPGGKKRTPRDCSLRQAVS